MAEALLAREVLDAEQVKRLAAGQALEDVQPASVSRPVVDEDEARPRQKERPSIVPALKQTHSAGITATEATDFSDS
jgi:hypothetical protein